MYISEYINIYVYKFQNPAKNKLCIGYECKYVVLGSVFPGPGPPKTTGIFLQIWIARRKCLCVSGKVVLWSIHWDIRVLVPIRYFNLWNYIYLPSSRQREAAGGYGMPPGGNGRQHRQISAHIRLPRTQNL